MPTNNQFQGDLVIDVSSEGQVIWRNLATGLNLFALQFTPGDPNGVLFAPKNSLAGGPAGLYQNTDGVSAWALLTAQVTSESILSSPAPAINTNAIEFFAIDALAEAILSFTTNLTGTPVRGQVLVVRILDDGVAHAIAWGSAFASRGAVLPFTTVAGKWMYVGFFWNEVTNTFDCVSVDQEP